MNETHNYQSETVNHHRGLRDLVREILDELKDFANTRFQVMKSELQETLSSVKVAVPLIAVALVLMFIALLLVSAAAVTLVARAFAGSSWAWFIACFARAAFFAYNEFRSKGRFPKRTVEVLKADRDWLQSEASNMQGVRP